jgi:hypothetical protein
VDTLSLCCAACIAFGDPASSFPITNDRSGAPVVFEALSALSFTSRSAAIDSAGSDGFSLDSLRLAVDATPLQRIHLRAALDTNTVGLGASEAFVEGSPAPGLLLRAGRFHVGPGAISARRLSQRCFVDTPVATERFFGRAGLIDQGVELTYTTPYAVSVSAFVLSGMDAVSFDAPYTSGMGQDLFGALLYGASLHVNAGLFMAPHALSIGLGVLSGENGTGPDNRTDVIWADAVGRFRASTDWSVGVDVEYLLRRFGIPYALVVEGGLSVDVAAFYRDSVWFGVRYDVFGLPRDPRESDHPFRVTAAAGFALSPLLQLRAQYSVRDDTAGGTIAHEGLFQVVAGWSGGVGTSGEPVPPDETAGRRPRHAQARRPAPGRPTGRPEDVLRTAATLVEQGQYAAATSVATRAALTVCTGTAVVAAEAPRMTCTEWLETLAAEGTLPPATVWNDVRLLERHRLALAPKVRRGAEALYDRQTAEEAVAAATRVLGFARTTVAPAPATVAPTPPTVEEPPPPPAPAAPNPAPAAPAPTPPQA